jgi:hypothetical protein
VDWNEVTGKYHERTFARDARRFAMVAAAGDETGINSLVPMRQRFSRN